MASPGAALLVAVLTFQYVFTGVSGECSNVTQFSTQIDLLLAEYDRETPPAAKVLVTIMLDVRHATIDEADSSVRLLADLKMSWQEPRVAWNASDWGCDSALAPAERLWLPDVEALNAAARGAGGGAGGPRARLASAGAVTWVTRLDLTAPIALALYEWPRDIQTANFKFASREHTLDELDLVVGDFIHAVVFEAGAWEIVSVRSSAATWDRSGAGGAGGADGVDGVDSAGGAGAGGEERGRVAQWEVRLRRRGAARAAVGGAVLAAAALLLAAAATLPPEARSSLAATASLLTALWLTGALARLPAGGGGCPRAAAVMCAVCAAGGAASAAAGLARALATRSAAPPRLLRALLSAASARCDLTPDQECPGAGDGAGGAWAAAARLLDRVLVGSLALTVLVLLAVYAL